MRSWRVLLGEGLQVDVVCRHGRFLFDRAAGCWMAWFVGGRALGRHGLHVAVVC